MKYTDLQSALDALKKIQDTHYVYQHVMGVLFVDAATAAPEKSVEGRGKVMEMFSGLSYDLIANPDNLELVKYLEDNSEALTPVQRRQVELLKKDCQQISRIPQEEYIAYNVLINEADTIWKKAKAENDFAAFAPTLQKIVEFNRKFAGYYNPELDPYDALLNEYEEGMTQPILDAFFAELRKTIVPLIHAVGQKPEIDSSFLNRYYPAEKQREFSRYLMDVIGIDKTRCTLAETEHPFTGGPNNHDVRITTHYYEDKLNSSMYSVIHEGGHAIYDMGCNDDYNYTFLAGGVSMGIHESQSRFYENLIGRSRAFVEKVFPKMQEIFPEQLGDVTAEMLYRAVNKAEPGLIRTESDELCYCMHIMVRYEMEKQLIAGTLAIEDVPETWNRLYREYLGVDVPNDAVGCLQDTHWAGGMIGYFPSYALGSAYGAQMKAVMEREIGNLEDLIAADRISDITLWLREHIHQHGSLYKPGQLFEMACGKFDPKYFADYLTKKYTELYQL